MGQDSIWHLQQLNQYVSVFNSSLSDSSSSSGSTSNGSAIRHHHHHQQQQHNNTSSLSVSAQTIAERLTAAAASQLTLTTTSSGTATTTQSTIFSGDIDDGTDTIIWNNWLLLLIILYCIVVFGGIFGNASLVITLYTQSSTRLRNPLLVALCLADLMVTGVAAPLTVVTLVLMVRRSWSYSSVYVCKSIYFMQVSLFSPFPDSKRRRKTHKIKLLRNSVDLNCDECQDERTGDTKNRLNLSFIIAFKIGRKARRFYFSFPMMKVNEIFDI